MKTVILIAAMIFCAVAAGIVGCGGRTKSAKAPVPAESTENLAAIGRTLQEIGSAPAAAIVSDKLGPFFWAGAGLAVIGSIAVVLGARAAGMSMFVMGGAVTMVGVLFSLYPWVVLPAFLIVGIIFLCKVVDAKKAKTRLVATEDARQRLDEFAHVAVAEIEVQPGGSEIKAAFKARGREVADAMRAVVDPIKADLEASGGLRKGA